MISTKKLGIWIDHSSAHIIESTYDPKEIKTIVFKSPHRVREKSIHIAEQNRNNREQNKTKEYYQKIEEVIKDYDDILLFGPSEAKAELHNLLKEDKHFANIKIEIKNTDKLTVSQQHAFVREHFKGR